MTIEIKQLVIRAVVDARRSEGDGQGQAPVAWPPGPSSRMGTMSLSRGERASIVASCVREVLRELAKSHER